LLNNNKASINITLVLGTYPHIVSPLPQSTWPKKIQTKILN